MQGDVFVATEVEVENYSNLVGDNELEGIVTWVANDYSQFSLNFRGNFAVDNATRFEDGTKADLKQGQEVEVTSVMKNGVRTVTNIEIDGPVLMAATIVTGKLKSLNVKVWYPTTISTLRLSK